MTKISVYDATSAADLNRALTDIEAALDSAQPITEEVAAHESGETEADASEITKPDFDIPIFSQLIGVRPEVYEQIRNVLKSGKRHLMFYGPPGTGKTSLAELVAGHLHTSHRMVTGSSDWSSQDVIGGYQPTGSGGIKFTKGVLLEHFDKPLIIDELNRCDIDRVLGPLFTVLSGQPTTLPYLTVAADDTSERYVILPASKPNPAENEFAPTENWRLLATINSIDKASLYQMSYALTRRFGWILVDAPEDLQAFLREYCTLKGFAPENLPVTAVSPFGEIWSAVNDARPMGAAPFIDAIGYCRAGSSSLDFFVPTTDETRGLYLDAFKVCVLPMLDGIAHEQANKIATGVSKALGINPDHPAAKDLSRRLAALAL